MAGYPVTIWVGLFWSTYTLLQGGISFNGWPDGGTYLEQDQFMLSVFEVMRDEAMREMKRQEKKRGK